MCVFHTTMTTVLFRKGSEAILFDPFEHGDGETTVEYFLLCTLLPDHRVKDVMTFGYSEEYETYFALDEENLLSKLHTDAEVEQFRVADQHAAHREISFRELFSAYPQYQDWKQIFGI